MALSFDLPPEMEGRLAFLAHELGLTQADLLRQVIENGTEEMEDYLTASRTLERVRRGEEQVYSSAEVWAHLGLDSCHSGSAQDELKFTVILEAESDGGYSVYCPALPGCVSQGDDKQSALENIKEAISLVLESWQEDELAPSLSDTRDALVSAFNQVLKGREEDGLPYAGVSLEQVEVSY